MEAAYTNNPRDFGLLSQLAQAYVKAGQKDRVAALLNGYVAQKDIPADAFLQAAQAYWNIGQHEQALNALQTMTERFPQDARGYYFVAMMRAMENNAAAALPMLEKAFADGKLKGFKPHPTAFVGYIIAHEAHHRGQVVLSLKQSGHHLDKKILFGL